MFRINVEQNAILPLKTRGFSELGFRERANLQEWIAKRPDCLGEDLLIIQKEFAGFSDTQERLDLLALDKQGSLVIIENKLDDTGRDVTWQALKYASYCSGLTKENIRKIFQEFLTKCGSNLVAEDELSAFFEVDDFSDIVLNKGVTQRVIIIAAKFRKEVTSTVLWLLNYKLRVQCFKVTPYSMGEELFLNVEQIIPAKDAEEFMIGLAEKAQDEIDGVTEEKNRHVVRRKFWTEILTEMNQKSQLYQNISPGNSSWIGAGSGMRGVGLNFAATKTYGRAEVYIDRGDKDENEWVFEKFYDQKEEIEASFGSSLVWDKLDTKRACRIKTEVNGNIFDSEAWPQMIAFMTDSMVRLEKTFLEPIAQINQQLKQR